MADLTFYTNPQSRGRIVRWMLEEVGEPYETEIIPYDEMKSERYLAVNPMGKVPAIKHRGHVVTECSAICAYLADAFPQAHEKEMRGPDDAGGRAFHQRVGSVPPPITITRCERAAPERCRTWSPVQCRRPHTRHRGSGPVRSLGSAMACAGRTQPAT